MEASFASVLERKDKSIRRQQRILEGLKGQRAAIAPRLGEHGIQMLDRSLRLHQERVERSLEEAQAERAVVLELVRKSPELPLEDNGKRKR
jgi:hypothetical protein